jgi:serine/threonine-protein kinase HipA
MRKAKIYMHDSLAGELTETDEGYRFVYDQEYLEKKGARAISLTMPLSKDPFTSPMLFPFFDGLIPEGWLLEIAEKNWKLDARDRMGLLLACCLDCIGAVGVVEEKPR